MTDVVVIGASIAGLAAAAQAASDGADVLLLDRRKSPRDDVPPATVAFDALWPRPPDLHGAEVARYKEIQVRAGASTAIVRAGARLYDRGLLDERLSRVAKTNGATIVWGARNVTIAKDRQVDWEGGSIRPRVLVLSDGPNGWGPLFVKNLQRPDEMRYGQAWELPRSKTLSTIEMSFSHRLPGGRLQLNPVGSRLVVWAFRRGRVPTVAEAVSGHPMLAAAATRLTLLGEARPDPVFALPGRISASGLILAGGAGGQGGLELGFHAGTAAGSTAAEAVRKHKTTARFLHDAYEKPWKARWGRGMERFRLAYNRFTALPVYEQENILEPWTRTTLDLSDVSLSPNRRPVRRGFAAVKASVRNAHRMRAVLCTYRQLTT
ncbi:MAG TPA: FAD-dependent oxidoreductase [Candidatus Thermoplasmatota archaeon]